MILRLRNTHISSNNVNSRPSSISRGAAAGVGSFVHVHAPHYSWKTIFSTNLTFDSGWTCSPDCLSKNSHHAASLLTDDCVCPRGDSDADIGAFFY